MKRNFVIILLIFNIALFSCKTKPTEVVEPESGLIEITKAQFQSEMMEFGEPVLTPFVDLVHFTGTIIPSVNGKAQISLPMPGVIAGIKYLPGQQIVKGAVLFEISGNEFIDMQQDFAESSALLERLKSDYERQKELNAENIGTKKEFVLAESLYNAEKAKFGAMKIKLENIGLDIVKIESGTFYTSFSLKSPIRGFITYINTTIGQYVEPQQIIAEIIDAGSFQVKLSVFEKDINKIKVGQNVEFYLAGNRDQKNAAKIRLAGKAIDNATKAIDCFAEIENLGNIPLVNNQYVEGEVMVDSDTVISLPGSAILKSENESIVLIFEKETDELFYFRKLKVTTGRKNNGFVEITELPESKRILINGVYNILIE